MLLYVLQQFSSHYKHASRAVRRTHQVPCGSFSSQRLSAFIFHPDSSWGQWVNTSRPLASQHWIQTFNEFGRWERQRERSKWQRIKMHLKAHSGLTYNTISFTIRHVRDTYMVFICFLKGLSIYIIYSIALTKAG